uniref:Uncharacterized protein n=1 Tax=Dictyoglomus turgidum TaxID=513050 RepID=A0A7C3SQT3_9BACT
MDKEDSGGGQRQDICNKEVTTDLVARFTMPSPNANNVLALIFTELVNIRKDFDDLIKLAHQFLEIEKTKR